MLSCSLAVVLCELRYHYLSFPCPSACVVSGLPEVKHAGALAFWPLPSEGHRVCVCVSCSFITRRSWTCLTAHEIPRLETEGPTLRSMRMGVEGSTPQEWPHGWSAQRRRSDIWVIRSSHFKSTWIKKIERNKFFFFFMCMVNQCTAF